MDNTSSKSLYVPARTLAIWLLVFSCGWAVMLTELVGARVLTPYFGNTIYVWGSVIAIFLLAMAVGYAIGGRMTQRFPSQYIPLIFAGLAGLYIALTPSFQDGLSAWLYNTGLEVKWGALIAAVILYGVPMALLGGVSPYCIQLATKTQGEVGSRAGVLYAISTVGSFMGCLVTAFILIPALPLPWITLAAGVGLMVVSVCVSLVVSYKVFPAIAVLVVAVIAGAFFANHEISGHRFSETKAYLYPLKGDVFSKLAPSEMGPVLKDAQAQASKEAAKYMSLQSAKTLLDMETPYHHMQILQEGPVREMVFGKSGFHRAQSIVDLRELNWHIAEYTHLMFAGLLYRPLPKRVLVIGVGGGMLPRAVESVAPGVEMDAVDIDPAVIRAARDLFFWRPSKNVRVYAQDGRSFINWAVINKRPKYDWVLIDAYDDDSVPFHLTTAEFIYTVKRVLTDDGIVASNMCVDKNLYGYEARTYESVFGNLNTFAGHRSGNVIMVCQNNRTKPLTADEAASTARKLQLARETRIDPQYIVGCLMNSRNWDKNGPVLTDFWAPVENLME